MIHYHGTPISPRAKMLAELAGRHFCVSWAEPRDIEIVHEIGQSVMLDNGAFSLWTVGRQPDWPGYYRWCRKWLVWPTTWAVIPDVIGGTEEENDLLLAEWFLTRLPRGAPVWHMHESLERLQRLCHGYDRVCIGSSGDFGDPKTSSWRERMEDAMNYICADGSPGTWLHMLRAMNQAAGGPYPFASADSTNLARNHNGSHRQPPRALREMADGIDGRQAPAHWVHVERTLELVTA